MLRAPLISRSFSSHNGAQPQFRIHILMNCEGRKIDALAYQINPPPAIFDNAVGFMIYGLNLMQDIPFLGDRFCASVLSVIVISIRINFQTSQQPPDAEQIPMFIDESICLSSIPFAKNAAAFFRKRFSFRASASFSRKRRFFFISSRSFWAVGFLRRFAGILR